MNAVTYFAPECRQAAADIGLRGFWMGYFACRAAPMGPVAPGVVESTFFNFHPTMVRRAIPDAWGIAAPESVLSARSSAAAAAITRLVPGADEVATAVVPSLLAAARRGAAAGRPLFAANRDLLERHRGVSALWQAATTLREHRGDGHVAVLTESGLDGCEALALFASTEEVPADLLRTARGWSEAEWGDAVERLTSRGLVTSEGGPTEGGRGLRRRIEQRTDELAAEPFDGVAGHAVDDLLRALRSVAQPIAASGEITFPNPMGLPRPSTEV